MEIVKPAGETPEQERRNHIRASHAAAFMADFDKVLKARIGFLTAQCAQRTGLPSRISLSGQAPVDDRLNKFVSYVLQELATVQVFQGKTFGRLLDILEGRGMPEGDNANGAAEGIGEGQDDQASRSAGDVGSPGEARTADGVNP